MKKTYLMLFIALTFFHLSCKKNPIDVEDISRFKKIFLTQAAEYPNEQRLDIIDAEQSVIFNASIGGKDPYDKDIQVTFDVMPELIDKFNQENNTNYELLPEESYRIEEKQATIKQGKKSSGPISIKLVTKGFLTAGNSYMLPVAITSVNVEVPINEQLQVAYYLFTGSYPLGEEPPTKVFDLAGKSLISLFTYSNFLTSMEGDGTLSLYIYDAAALSFKSSSPITNGGWNIFDQVLPTNSGFITRWAGSGILWEYSVTNAGAISGDFQGKGTGFNVYDLMTFSKNHNSIFCRKPNGKLYHVKREGPIWNVTTEVGSGWDKYTQIIAYEDGLLAIDGSGEMEYFPVNEKNEIGEPKHIGSGWNKYSRVLSYGTDLLALDYLGVLWRYKFDLRAEWNVRKN